MNARRALLIVLVLAGLIALSKMAILPLLVRAQGLTIGGYQLVSEVPVSPTVSEYTYTAVLTNPGPALAGATAHVASQTPHLVVVDADLTFGTIAAGGSATSVDAFSFREERTLAFNPANLVWTVTPSSANRPPIGVLAPPGPASVTQPVQLDGTGSSDPDGDAITFLWTLVSRPVGSGAVVNTPTNALASFLPDRAGSYLVRLEVSDGQLTATADLSITTDNSAPRANAGPDQTVVRNTVVTVDGSGSSDVDGDALTYQWSVMSRPTGSAATLSDATSVRPTFVADLAGVYVLRLVVNDGRVSSEADVVIVNTGNSAPVANAGPDQTVRRSATVVLDASASTDVDGDQLTYLWEFVSRPIGSAAVLSDATSVQPRFVADLRGTFELRLTVRDGQVSSQDAVTITTENSRPVAIAGVDRTAPLSATVTLDGSASTDVDGDSLTYQWSLTSVPVGSTAALSTSSAVAPTFVVDLRGSYIAQLVVSDGMAASAPATVTIGTENTRPIAEAGQNQSILAGEIVLLDGSGSRDPDGDPLRYSWSLTTVPLGSAATLTDPTSIRPSFIADRPGAYLLQLVVDDGRLSSSPDTVTVTTTMNTPPVANAGPDQLNLMIGTLVALDGSASSDADGHALTFQWSLLSAPSGATATLAGATGSRPTFVPDLSGTYVAQLIVTDGVLASLPDTVQIQVRGANRPPVADAGPDRVVVIGGSAVLDGSASSDPDGDSLIFAWTLVSAPAASTAALVNPSSVTPMLTPDVPGDYVVALVVNDGAVDSVSDSAKVTTTAAPATPTIAGFTPTSGRVGDVVSVRGENFVGVQAVAFGGVVVPTFTVVDANSLSVLVPAAALTGPIAVTTTTGTATSTAQFVVLANQDFQLTATPDVVTVPAGGQGAFQINVKGSGGFSNLATLAVSGVPASAAATFGASTLTSGQSTQLTVLSSGVASGSLPLTITATGRVNGVETTRTATVTLQIAAPGVTSIAGQFLTVAEVPIPNVLVMMGPVQAHSDAAGNFLLQNVTEGFQPLMIDANVAVAGYPIYKVDLQVVAGQTLTLPTFRITPPPPPERYTPFDNATQDQLITDPRFPGFELTLPRGATITGWDGVRKSKVAIERILPSQLPVPPPPGPTQSLYQIHFGTPMGGIPTARLPVTLPNDQGLDPGQQGEIWWFDAAPTGGPGAWKFAGMGTISADGRKLVSNPGVGIDRFCGVCGLVCFINRLETLANRILNSPVGGDPVDLALGQMIVDKTDLVLPGRLPALVHRTYNPIDAFGGIAGFGLGLGQGWALSVDVTLLEVNASLRRLILPGNARFDLVVQPDGSFMETKNLAFAGAVLTNQGGGAHRLRFKDGTVWRFARTFLNGVDLLAEEIDRNGNNLTIERDNRGVVIRIVEPSGRALLFSQAAGRITQVADPIGRATRYSYDSSGRLELVTDAGGGTTRYTYDASGRIVTITDAKGIEFIRNEYSPLSGRILRQLEADGSVWAFKYQVLPRVMTATPMALNPVAVEESTAAIAAGLSGDLRNPPISTTVVDPRGHATTYTLFAGLSTVIVDALGQRTRLERDIKGRVTRATDPLGRETRFEYDTRGNVTRVTDPQNNVSLFEYEPTFNKVTKIADALGNVTTFEYDATGNTTRVIDPEQNSTRIAYDAFGQPISATDSLGNVTTFTHDDRGNLVTVADPLGNTSRIAYDLVSRVTAQTDPRAQTTSFAYDALNQVTKITDALGGETGFSYDPNGNLLTVSDARQNAVKYEYDSMDRLTKRIDPLGRQESFTYDANGNLMTATDRKSQTTTFAYDSLDRRTRSQFADGALAEFQYDAVGRLVRADDSADPHRPVALAYDTLNRLTMETTAIGSVSYTYDVLGRRTEMLASGAQPVRYEYDRSSRLRSITQAPMNPARIDYDAANRRTSLTLPNGVSTEYRYDEASRLSDLIYRNALGPIGNLTYQYDRSGNRVGVGGSLARSGLPDAVAQTSYDAANQQQQIGSRQLAYDANGNLSSFIEPAGQTQYTWDARNRLVSLNGPAATGAFAYDALGRRASKDVNGRRTQYSYDGLDTISELTNGAPVSYLRSLFIDEALVRNGSEGYIADALGSTVGLTDPSGAIRTQYTYEPFGNTVASGVQSDNAIQYTGRENDGTGLSFYRSRYYNPQLSRFISEDPIGLRGGDANFYAYVGGAPTNYADPGGMFAYRRTWNDAFETWAFNNADYIPVVCSADAFFFFGRGGKVKDFVGLPGISGSVSGLTDWRLTRGPNGNGWEVQKYENLALVELGGQKNGVGLLFKLAGRKSSLSEILYFRKLVGTPGESEAFGAGVGSLLGYDLSERSVAVGLYGEAKLKWGVGGGVAINFKTLASCLESLGLR